MAFGFAGAGAGAAKALEEILGEQMLRAQLAQREQQAQAEMAMRQQQLAESARQADVDSGQRQQQIDLQAGDRRERSNIKGVRRMLGEAITQRTGPMTPDDRRGMAALQVEAGDAPTMLNEPKVVRHAVTTRGDRGQPVRKLVTEDELAGGIEEYREPKTGPAPARDPIADYEARLKLDQKYKPSQTGNNAEAIDTAREAKRLATELLNHKGFSGAFGLAQSYLPTIRQDTADAEVIRNSLQDLLTLENMEKMKGILSDSDMKILRSASTTVNARMGDDAARRELNRVIAVMDKVTGEVPPSSDPGLNRGITAAPIPGVPKDDIDAMIERLRKPKG